MVGQIMVHFKKTISFLFFISMVSVSSLPAENLTSLQAQTLTVFFDNNLEPAALEVLRIYPGVRNELENNLFWSVDFRPSVILIGDHDRFLQMSGSGFYLAYAVPEKLLIVIDCSRMNTRLFTLRATLKHELCHLLLHRHITKVHLPRWLDEGVAQWASEGIAEIVMGRKESIHNWAALTGGFIRLDALSYHFPQNEHDIVLAYVQSRSIAEHIITNHGKTGLLNILETMRAGVDSDKAIEMSLMLSVDELEQQWLKEQRSWNRVFSFLGTNIYTVIFILASFLTMAMYVRAVIRKRRYRDEDTAEDHLEASVPVKDHHRQ
ncbi:MAG TPA: hypothetical protein ENN05_06405 [Deltaproteobacteria bacterium]|nr:hypothetical protein [Deltaproteobacteria bacterium]